MNTDKLFQMNGYKLMVQINCSQFCVNLSSYVNHMMIIQFRYKNNIILMMSLLTTFYDQALRHKSSKSFTFKLKIKSSERKGFKNTPIVSKLTAGNNAIHLRVGFLTFPIKFPCILFQTTL